MNNINEGTQCHKVSNDAGTKGIRCYTLSDDTTTEKTEPEVEILHPNTSENIHCFINAMPDGQKETFAKSNGDAILRALLG